MEYVCVIVRCVAWRLLPAVQRHACSHRYCPPDGCCCCYCCPYIVTCSAAFHSVVHLLVCVVCVLVCTPRRTINLQWMTIVQAAAANTGARVRALAFMCPYNHRNVRDKWSPYLSHNVCMALCVSLSARCCCVARTLKRLCATLRTYAADIRHTGEHREFVRT